jgi:hypothetical protein
MGLECGPFSLVSTIKELLGRKNSDPGLEKRDYGSRESVTLTILYPQKFPLTSPTSGGRSVGIVRSWTNATEFVCSVTGPKGVSDTKTDWPSDSRS